MLNFTLFLFFLLIPGLISAVQHIQIRKAEYDKAFIVAMFIYSYLILMLMSATKYLMGNGFDVYQILEDALTYNLIFKYSALALIYAILLPPAIFLIELIGVKIWRK